MTALAREVWRRLQLCRGLGLAPLALFVPLLLPLLLSACAGSPQRSDGQGAAAPRITLTPQKYKVRRGDTLSSIAWLYRLDYRSLAEWNGLKAPYVIHPGQRLVVNPPPGWQSASARPASPVQPSSSPKAVTTPYLLPGQSMPRPDSSAGAVGRRPYPVQPAPPQGQSPANEKPSPEVAPVHWRWPTRGKIVRSFAPGGSSGIDITGAAGQAVVAAAPGVVVYSGSALKGYGELIIIRHTENLLSAYGHNSKRFVREGAKVKQGELIAHMGSTDARVPLLHFEIRYRGKPVDPRQYLP